MGNKLNLKGNRFGKLVAIQDVGKTKAGIYNWLCKCDCGNSTIVRVTSLTYGTTKSCGCLISQSTTMRFTKHGQATSSRQTSEYLAWENMKARCYKKSTIGFQNYGGRGIRVCKRWRHSFENFYKDMGGKPSMKHSLDRYPNINGDYKPSNCRWATKGQQLRGTRRNHWLEYNGVKMVISDWAKRLGVWPPSITWHLKTKTFREVVEYYISKNKFKWAKN